MVSSPRCWISHLVGDECVARHVIRAGVRLAAGAAERVDGRSDADVGESRFFEHLLPALTGRPSGNSTGPQIDVAKRVGRNGSTVGDVGELQHTSGTEHAVDLLEDSALVGAEVD